MEKKQPSKDVISSAVDSQLKNFSVDRTSSDIDQEYVHQLRVLTKKLRAYLALYPQCCRENVESARAMLKAVANEYGGQRDGYVLRKTFEALIGTLDKDQQRPFQEVRREIENQLATVNASGRSATAAQALKLVHTRWPAYALSHNERVNGINRLYTKAQKQGKKSISHGFESEHHEWRKRVKQLYYCLLLLDGPGKVKRARRGLKELGEMLGEYHDITVLEEFLRRKSRVNLATDARNAFQRAVDRKKSKLNKFFKKSFHQLFAKKSFF